MTARTGSIGSRVGPAVTSTRRPASTFGWKNATRSSSSSCGSSMRPLPISPQAWSPDAGPSTTTPSATSRATFRCVAGCAHICRFIAGATSSGQARAMHIVVSRSSQIPFASFAMKSVDAGTTAIASASRDRSICGMLLGCRASHWSVNTGRPVNACIVTGVMKRVAASVITTCTVAPRSSSRRASSAVL